MANRKRYFQLRDFDKALNADVVKKSQGNPLPWIKSHCGQLEDPEYCRLTPGERGLLGDLRLLAARRGNKIFDDETYLIAQLKYKSRTRLAQKLHTLRALRFLEPYNSDGKTPAKEGDDSRTILERSESASRLEKRREDKSKSNGQSSASSYAVRARLRI